MGRKPKNQTNEGSSPPPLTPPSLEEEDLIIDTSKVEPNIENVTVEDPPVFEDFTQTIEIDTASDNMTETITITQPTYYPYNTSEAISYLNDEMKWAQLEIERCNDYIYAKADLDRRFSVYRDELYEYRYKIRQLQFITGYPNIDKSRLPKKPDFVADV